MGLSFSPSTYSISAFLYSTHCGNEPAVFWNLLNIFSKYLVKLESKKKQKKKKKSTHNFTCMSGEDENFYRQKLHIVHTYL